MRRLALHLAAAALVLLGGVASSAESVSVKRAVLRTRMVALHYFPEDPGPPRVPMADVNIRGFLPDGFTLDGSGGPAPVHVFLRGQEILGDEWGLIALAPRGQRGRWDLASREDGTFAPWLRARLDLRRRTFHFRTRYAEHGVMEGASDGVPLVVRIGDSGFEGEIDFRAANPDLWRSCP